MRVGITDLAEIFAVVRVCRYRLTHALDMLPNVALVACDRMGPIVVDYAAYATHTVLLVSWREIFLVEEFRHEVGRNVSLATGACGRESFVPLYRRE